MRLKKLTILFCALGFILIANYYYNSLENINVSIPSLNILAGKYDTSTVIDATVDTQSIEEVSLVFSESFGRNFILEEAWPKERSKNRDWWVSSGAYLVSEGGFGRTLFGNLESTNRWFKKYKDSNSLDTKGGARPQNIFRLVTKDQFLNFSQELYFQILYYDENKSAYRNESNGVHLFNRYQDENNLYYTGIRVDGKAVVKKKWNGVYSTLEEVQVFHEEEEYDRDTNPNVLPLNTWIGIKSIVHSLDSDRVQVDVFIDRDESGEWAHVLSVIDEGTVNGPVINQGGSGGIRTDFMDVQFDNYVIKEE